MLNIIIYGLSAILISGFFYLDGHLIVKNSAIVKWKKFRKINRLVSTNYKGFFIILWISIYMVIQALWINFIQYMNSSVVQLNGCKYEISYVIKGKIYKMIVKPIKGPKRVLLISDDMENDITHHIGPYLGPEENFHNKMFTPDFFNKKELIFQLSDGTELVFNQFDNIIIHEK